MWKKAQNCLYKLSELLELLMGVVVIAAIVIAVVGLIPQFQSFWQNRAYEASLMELLGYVFNIVIGIEFLKMLCKPKADTIVEVLLFLVARHMIIGETTAVEDLLSIISVGILFLLKFYVIDLAKWEGKSSFFGKKKSKEKKMDVVESPEEK